MRPLASAAAAAAARGAAALLRCSAGAVAGAGSPRGAARAWPRELGTARAAARFEKVGFARPPPLPRGTEPMAGVRAIVAVASGKGGVGKSTVAANLAAALAGEASRVGAARPLRVGLMDADVYGPSVPTMFNLSGEPAVDSRERMLPLENYNVRCMSMGFLLKQGAAAVWRGPMVSSALERLSRGVAWGELDVMLIDMPPGTGDAQLSVAQRLPLAGAVIVSTPQQVALDDVRRGIAMFEAVKVPVLGVVENMAYYQCGGCGKHEYIFGRGGARAVADELSVPVLGEVPLEPAVCESSDAGVPVAIGAPDSAAGEAYFAIASTLVRELGLDQDARDGEGRAETS